jgi:hypothetical protein
MAFNGYRGDYTTTVACQTCHDGTTGIPAVYHEWSETAHANAGWEGQANRLPYGSSCGGCHTANYDPSKVVPTLASLAPTPKPTATILGVPTPAPTATLAVWVAANGTATDPQTTGSAASSESFVGCSSCHYGANVFDSLAIFGVDPNDTAHTAPNANLANAAICGQCHSRYSYTVNTYAVATGCM